MTLWLHKHSSISQSFSIELSVESGLARLLIQPACKCMDFSVIVSNIDDNVPHSLQSVNPVHCFLHLGLGVKANIF